MVNGNEGILNDLIVPFIIEYMVGIILSNY